MIPVRDIVPSRTRPVITLTLVAAGFVATALGSAARSPLDVHAAAPTLSAYLVTGLDHGAWVLWAANGLLLWLLGPAVEDRTGRGRFALLYGAGGLAGLATLALVGLPIPSMAVAAAATGGVAAAHLASFPDSRILAVAPGAAGWTVVEWPSTAVVGCWLLVPAADALGLIDLSPSLLAGAALAATLAGGLCGAAAMRLLRRPERLRVEWWDDPLGDNRS